MHPRPLPPLSSHIPSRTLPGKACWWLGRQVLRFPSWFLNPTGRVPSPRAADPPVRHLEDGLPGAILHHPGGQNHNGRRHYTSPGRSNRPPHERMLGARSLRPGWLLEERHRAALWAPPAALEGARHGGARFAPRDPGPVHAARQVTGLAALPTGRPGHFQRAHGGFLHRVGVAGAGRFAPGERTGGAEGAGGRTRARAAGGACATETGGGTR